jgi:flagellar biosynthesis/type III secretory pathway protein FliH
VQAAGNSLDAQGDARRAMGHALRAARRAGQLDTDQATAIYIFLDAVNRLPEALAETIDHEVELIEEAPVAQLLTRWERRGWRQGREEGREEGLEQGREQGMIEGLSAMILNQLNQRQIALDAPTEERIRSLDSDMLLALGAALFTFQTRADLDAWLAQATTKE